MTYDIHRAALDRFGFPAQLRKTGEECLELALAITQHMDDGRQTDIIGELADVLIMTQQMRLAFGTEDVDRAVEMKLERLRGRLDG